MVPKWPEYDTALSFEQDRAKMRRVMDTIRTVRNRRAGMSVSLSHKAYLSITVAGTATDTLHANIDMISRLAYASQIEIADFWDLSDAVTIVADATTLYILTDELVDKRAELARSEKELESIRKQLDSAEAKLKSEAFFSKAPGNVVDGMRRSAEKLAEKTTGTRLAIQNLSK